MNQVQFSRFKQKEVRNDRILPSYIDCIELKFNTILLAAYKQHQKLRLSGCFDFVIIQKFNELRLKKTSHTPS